MRKTNQREKHVIVVLSVVWAHQIQTDLKSDLKQSDHRADFEIKRRWRRKWDKQITAAERKRGEGKESLCPCGRFICISTSEHAAKNTNIKWGNRKQVWPNHDKHIENSEKTHIYTTRHDRGNFSKPLAFWVSDAQITVDKSPLWPLKDVTCTLSQIPFQTFRCDSCPWCSLWRLTLRLQPFECIFRPILCLVLIWAQTLGKENKQPVGLIYKFLYLYSSPIFPSDFTPHNFLSLMSVFSVCLSVCLMDGSKYYTTHEPMSQQLQKEMEMEKNSPVHKPAAGRRTSSAPVQLLLCSPTETDWDHDRRLGRMP